uniref:protein brown-like isoform X3 n=1 Tax=Vespula vulgaris TaxID=7454 RepID=UPI00223BC14D|nr:protein brown-like isoform X3 [Vespula vulgaris]
MDFVVSNENNRKKITLSWENVTVSINDQKQTFLQSVWSNIRRKSRIRKLEILKQVSGYVESNNMIAIMGPSGAGKTTLLSTIAKKIQPSCGSIKINGLDVSNIVMSQISSYMDQYNEISIDLTPREHLLFMCALKMDKNTSYRERSDRTNKLLNEFGLHECKNNLITKLSAGERKRLFLISELVARPKIIFLDEPTTADGRNIFSGSIKDLEPFFESLGFKCPAGIDQLEYHISILSQHDSMKSTEEQSLKISEAFLQSSYYKLPAFNRDSKEKIQSNLCNKPGPLKQLFWLLWRIYKKKKRTLFSDNLSWISFLISMIVVSVFFYGNNSNTQKGMQNVRGALYLMTSEIIFTVAYSVIYELPSDIINYLRETSIYGPGVYYIATFIGLIPKSIIKSFIFTLSIILTLHNNIHWNDISYYCLTTALGAICGTAYGMMMSSWTLNVNLTSMIMVPIDMFFLLTAGMFYNLRSLPIFLGYIKYLSIFYYINECLSILYWSHVNKIECEPDEGLPCLKNGTEVLYEYGYNELNFILDLCGMILLTIFMSIVGYFGIKRSRRISLLS